MMSQDPQLVQSLDAVLGRYNGVLLDQFGVIHDGCKPLPGAVPALRRIYESGAPIVILSNSTMRSGPTIDRLESLGFDRKLFSGAVTGGEQAWHKIRALVADQTMGPRCLWLARTDPNGRYKLFFEGLGTKFVASVADADFIVLQGCCVVGAGSESPRAFGYDYEACGECKDDVERMLREAARRNLPVHCLNPDRVAVQPDGTLAYVPGSLAAHYRRIYAEENKGVSPDKIPLYMYGKPNQGAFQRAIELLRAAGQARPRRVIMVGDSMEHDIQGANRSGVDSLFVASGIHAEEVIPLAVRPMARPWWATVLGWAAKGVGAALATALTAWSAPFCGNMFPKLTGFTGPATAAPSNNTVPATWAWSTRWVLWLLALQAAGSGVSGMFNDAWAVAGVDRSALSKLCETFQARPTYVIRAFK